MDGLGVFPSGMQRSALPNHHWEVSLSKASEPNKL
jgi:hypothetical protein